MHRCHRNENCGDEAMKLTYKEVLEKTIQQGINILHEGGDGRPLNDQEHSTYTCYGCEYMKLHAPRSQWPEGCPTNDLGKMMGHDCGKPYDTETIFQAIEMADTMLEELS